jgi:carboxypeptidase PM20D1
VSSAEPGDAGIAERYLDHLAAAVRIPTVVFEDRERIDLSQFDRFHEFLRETYPLVFERLHPENPIGHSLLFRWDGADPEAPPILLMGHMDVVPVEEGTEAEWSAEPFAAQRDDTHLWGRGTLDDKGAVIALFDAVERLLAEGFQPEVTLYLSLGHDEEIGGGEGATTVAGLLAERGVHFEFVLDEGGAVVERFLPGASAAVALIGVGEKGYANVEIEAVAAGGHSSTPPPHSAVGRVAAAVAALEANPMPTRLEIQEQLFDVIGGALPGLRGRLLRHARRFRRVVEPRLEESPQTNALIRTTAAATMIEGGVKPNVLPQRARAVVNFRVLPGDSIEEVVEHVRAVAGEGVEVRLLEGGFTADPSPISDSSSASFRLIADTVAEVFPGALVAPWILMGATDSRHFLPIADGVFRFGPFRLTPEDMTRIHGTDERIRIADAAAAVTFYERLIRRACGPV